LALAQVSRHFDDEIPWLPAFAAVISCDFSQRPDDHMTPHSEMLKFNKNEGKTWKIEKNLQNRF